jgi:hypothetical protein
MANQEEKWFETYTWNGEPNTRYIVFRQRKYSSLIRNMVDGYLKSLGFVDQTDPEYAKASNQSTLVDLGAKTYQHLSAWRMHQTKTEMGADIPLAYPSQMTIFMTKHFGAVAGHRFGL